MSEKKNLTAGLRSKEAGPINRKTGDTRDLALQIALTVVALLGSLVFDGSGAKHQDLKGHGAPRREKTGMATPVPEFVSVNRTAAALQAAEKKDPEAAELAIDALTKETRDQFIAANGRDPGNSDSR